ncbi:MAG: hypothetical protein DI585_00850 [Pseudomonas fluorescens]|nr:MAG: hypothetical protein DI585_00850 [Pseudomonas fluorescens]
MRLTFSPALIKKAERWIFALIGGTVVVTLGATLLASKESLGDSLYAIPWAAVGWLAFLTVVESTIRFWRYDIAARVLKLNVPFWRLMYYYTVGYALLPTPGKVGTAIRLWLLKQYHGLPYSRTAPLLIMDFVSDSIAMISLASLSLLVLDDPRLKTLGFILGAGLTVAVVATLIAPRYMAASVKMMYAATGKRSPRKFARIQMLVRTTATVLGPRLLLTTIALSFVGWALIGMGIAHLVTQFGIPFFTATEGSLVIALGTMGGFLTMMPAGVGGAEATMGGLFVMFGVPFAQAVLITALVRLLVLWFTVLAGLALLPIALRNAPNRKT